MLVALLGGAGSEVLDRLYTKRLIDIGVPFADPVVIIGALLLFGVFLMGAQPTITQSTSYNAGGSNYYKYTFSTDIAAADSAIFYKDNSSAPFDISYLARQSEGNQKVLVTLNSSEATADSIRYVYEHQVSFDGTTWAIWEIDTLENALQFAVTFSPLDYGNPYYYRGVLRESDANKDASQDVTLELIFPTPR